MPRLYGIGTVVTTAALFLPRSRQTFLSCGKIATGHPLLCLILDGVLSLGHGKCRSHNRAAWYFSASLSATLRCCAAGGRLAHFLPWSFI